MRPSVKPPYLVLKVRHTTATALLTLGLLSLLPDQAEAQCQSTFPASCPNPCGSGQVCSVVGQCVTGCSSAAQCGSGETCLLSQCLKFPCYGKPIAGVPEKHFCGAVNQGKVHLGLPPDDCPQDFTVYDAQPPGGKPISMQSCVWTPPAQTALHTLWLDGGIGPLEVCIGPDLVVRSFKVDSQGAAVTYRATVCNYGSKVAEKFRVGFWHDRATEPAAIEMGDVFKGIVSLDAATICPAPKIGIGNPVDVRPLLIPACVDVLVPGGLRPNGSFKAWCRVDSGAFVEECREGNNGHAPIPYNLSNPDLQIASFEAAVAGSQVTYTTKVCNLGTADVSKFYVDVYYDRPKMPPIIGEPGDVVKPVLNLKAGDCTTLSFVRASAPKGSSICYVFADPDDFISEPNETNNLSSPLPVQVGEGGASDGGTGPSGECVDTDKDGFGVGPGCVGIPDCNDADPTLSPGVPEVCGDKLDNDCDLTPDDGCPGVDCVDGDGDGFGVGKECVLADCDDKNKAIHPFAKESCGNNKDENCDKIADDGCAGRQCVDLDMDGYGVGAGCPGPQDCNDKDFFANPGAKEACGDGKDNDCDGVADDGCTTSVDGDGDGFPVGKPKPGYPPDCGEGDSSVYPGAKEVCGDGKDNNCNGTVDDDCPGVDCKDGDGDGWPVGKDCKVSDCDDADPKLHPFAEEVCGDGKDQNCNGSNDEGCAGVACEDKDGDGWPVGKACGAKQDCDDADGGASPWRPEICADGKDQDCSGAIDEGCPLCEDKDADGHGIGPQCSSWDCDDNDAKTYPGAKELCDKKDNSCDGTTDEDCEGGEGGGCGCALPADGAAGPLSLLGLALLVGVLLGARRSRGGARPGK